MTNAERFDRIRAGLLKQEVMRKGTIQSFKDWVGKARPHWDALVAEYTAECERHYGLVLCEWLDWLDTNRLAWKGEIRWQIPTKGPLIFTPPSTGGLMMKIGELLGEYDLVGVTQRLARSSAGPIEKTRGASGGKVRKPLTVRKLTPGGTT